MFFTLPPEIRTMIYRELLLQDDLRPRLLNYRLGKGYRPDVHPHILSTCRQIRDEARELFYSNTVFAMAVEDARDVSDPEWIADGGGLEVFCLKLGYANCRLIRKASFTFHDWCEESDINMSKLLPLHLTFLVICKYMPNIQEVHFSGLLFKRVYGDPELCDADICRFHCGCMAVYIRYMKNIKRVSFERPVDSSGKFLPENSPAVEEFKGLLLSEMGTRRDIDFVPPRHVKVN
jgi:hypothetical protein